MKAVLGFVTALAVFFMSACMVGPKYVRPSAPSTPEFKEPGPTTFKEIDGWKTAQPGDSSLRGNWWELFNDPGASVVWNEKQR
jgi:hypothetical protein